MRVPGVLSFKKGHMSGGGTNGLFDQNNDVLTINEKAAVTVLDDEGHPTTDFTAGSAVLDRAQHVLTLDKQVHVVRGAQVTDTDHSTARLSENNEVITRGSSWNIASRQDERIGFTPTRSSSEARYQL